ncbi:restriction endonuclease subunit S [Dysgonomonas sp.]
MNKKLSEIANIRSGVFLSQNLDGNIRYLQIIDFDNEGMLNPRMETTPMVLFEKNISGHLLKQGDILFSAKGDNNYSVVYQEKNIQSVASTSFIIIAIKNEYKSQILPEYICWHMNKPDTIKTLKDKSKGTKIHSVSIFEIRNFEIFIPPLKQQILIEKVDSLLKEERIIQNKLYSLRKQLLINFIK